MLARVGQSRDSGPWVIPLWTLPISPVQCLLVPQDLQDLLSADLLVLGVAGQAVHEEGDAAGRGVVALEHEGVHLRPDDLVWQGVIVLILGAPRQKTDQTPDTCDGLGAETTGTANLNDCHVIVPCLGDTASAGSTLADLNPIDNTAILRNEQGIIL